MIGTITIKTNATHPNIPLTTMFSFVNSPSSLRIIDVPKKIGSWKIEKVFVEVSYPNNEKSRVECVQVGGAFVCTLPPSTIIGSVEKGYCVIADGTDERGSEVNNFILGCGDVEVLDVDGRISVGDKTYFLHFMNETPTNPNIGDVIMDENGMKFFDGNDWKVFTRLDTTLSIEGQAADSKAVGDELDKKLNLSGGDMSGEIMFGVTHDIRYTNPIYGDGTTIDKDGIHLPLHNDIGKFRYILYGAGGTDKNHYKFHFRSPPSAKIDATVAYLDDIDGKANVSDLSSKADAEIVDVKTYASGLFYGRKDDFSPSNLILSSDGRFRDYIADYEVEFDDDDEEFYIEALQNSNRNGKIRNCRTRQIYTSRWIAYDDEDQWEIFDGDEDWDDITYAKDVLIKTTKKPNSVIESIESHTCPREEIEPKLTSLDTRLKNVSSMVTSYNTRFNTMDNKISTKIEKTQTKHFDETRQENNNASSWGILFRPRAFGVTQKAYLKSFSIKTRLATGTPQPSIPIYYKLIDFVDGRDNVLAIVKEGKMMNEWESVVEFEMDRLVELDPDHQYRLVSYSSPDATSSTFVGIRLASNPSGNDDLYYNSDMNNRPIMTADFIISETQTDINENLSNFYTKREVEALIRKLISSQS